MKFHVGGFDKQFGPDSSRSWIVAFFGGVFLFFATLTLRSQGIMFVGILEDFSVTREMAAWPQAFYVIGLHFGSPLISVATYFISTHSVLVVSAAVTVATFFICYLHPSLTILSIFYGLFQGVASAGIFIAVNVIVAEHFERYRSIAISMIAFGATLNSLILPYLSHWFHAYRTPEALLLTGALCLNLLPLGAAIKSPRWILERRQKQAQNNGTSSKIDNPNSKKRTRTFSQLDMEAQCAEISASARQLSGEKSYPLEKKHSCKHLLSYLWNPVFYIDAISFSVVANSMAVFLLLSIDYSKDLGLSDADAVLVLQCFCIGDMIFRAAVGILIDGKIFSLNFIMAVGSLIQVIAFIAITWLNILWALCIAVFFIGVSNGSRISLLTLMLIDDCGLDTLTFVMPYAYVIIGVVGIFRPMMIGYCRDTLGDYSSLFYILALSNLIVSIVWFARFFLKRCHTSKNSTDCSNKT